MGSGNYRVRRSEDGGESWGEAAINETLPGGVQDKDYGIMGGVPRLPVEGEDILIFSNIISENRSGDHWGRA